MTLILLLLSLVQDPSTQADAVKQPPPPPSSPGEWPWQI